MSEEAGVKSGIRNFKQGDILFKEKDSAASLFIIQRGQIRLFVQKGKGFVDISILRAGEVIGEMAYFDERATSRRSCSAEALSQVEVVEVTFIAFDKAMKGMNPWFRTIVNTLAERLRTTNDKVKSLENNSVGFGADGRSGNYVFFHNVDLVKIISLLYLMFKSHGEIVEGKIKLHFEKMKMYMNEIFNISEIKIEELMTILKAESFISIENDEKKLPKVYVIDNIDTYKQLLNYFNTQRLLDDTKKINISFKCQIFLDAIIRQVQGKADQEGNATVNITEILDEFKQKNIAVTEEDLGDSAKAGFTGALVVGDKNAVTTSVAISKLEKLWPSIRLQNAVKKLNEKKAKS